jgi:hypothetical protein
MNPQEQRAWEAYDRRERERVALHEVAHGLMLRAFEREEHRHERESGARLPTALVHGARMSPYRRVRTSTRSTKPRMIHNAVKPLSLRGGARAPERESDA